MRLKRYLFSIACISLLIYLSLKYSLWGILIPSQNQTTLQASQVVINEVMIQNRNSISDDEGDFESWMEIYNNGDNPINLEGFGLSSNPKEPFYWTFPKIELGAHDFLLVWMSGKNTSSEESFHTNFKLRSKDNTLLLTDPFARYQDIFPLEKMGENISMGRFPDGSNQYTAFDQGSPKSTNQGDPLVLGAQTPQLAEPTFSHKSGFYTETFQLKLTTPLEESIIYYTLDGSIPDQSTNRYTNPITISSKVDTPTVVSARLYKSGYPTSNVISHTYFVSKNIHQQYTLPLVSLITDPSNLFDYKKGIYTSGKIYDDWIKAHPFEQPTANTPANYNQRGKLWERPVYMEYFTQEGSLAFSQSIGMRISGGFSRSQPLKSLALHASKTYDEVDVFEYDFFDSNSYSPVSSILLRCSGNDYQFTLFRDAFIQSLIPSDIKLDTQASTPCIVFINGDYYGIHNIREAYNKDTLGQNYHIPPNEIVILKNPNGINPLSVDEGFAGDEMHYKRLIDYVTTINLNSKTAYEFINNQIDIDNFIEYNILQIYAANRDWPGNNVRLWRRRTPNTLENVPYGHDGRWRWLTFDLDYTFGIYSNSARYTVDSLANATAKEGAEWPNPPWSTLLLRSLLENEAFKVQFINTFADRLNTAFLPSKVISHLKTFQGLYETSIPRHLDRWNLHKKNIHNWYKEIQKMSIFATHRPTYVRQHITDYFDLEGTTSLSLSIQDGGKVNLNSLSLETAQSPWTGEYFQGIPITIEAVPLPGYSFAGWEGGIVSKETTLILSLTEALTLRATFIPNSN